jgi:hypothetical protein
VLGANGGLATTSAGDTVTGTAHDAEEIHTVDTDGGIVLDTKIDVFLDTETEVAGSREVASQKFVLLNLEATLENFLSLGTYNKQITLVKTNKIASFIL